MDKRLELWENELPQDKLVLLAYACKKDVDETVDRKMYAVNQALGDSIRSALYELHDFTIEQANEVIRKTNEFLEGADLFFSKYKEDWIMQIEKVRPEIEEMVIQGLREIEANKTDKLQVIKAIQKKFKVPPTSIDKIYMEIKEKEFNDSCPEQYKAKSTQNKPESEHKESSNVIIPKKENESTMERIGKSTNEFEVVEKKIVFRGKFGGYVKVKNGLKAGSIFFKNLDEIDAYKKKELDELKKQIELFNSEVDEIKAAFSFEG